MAAVYPLEVEAGCRHSGRLPISVCRVAVELVENRASRRSFRRSINHRSINRRDTHLRTRQPRLDGTHQHRGRRRRSISLQHGRLPISVCRAVDRAAVRLSRPFSRLHRVDRVVGRVAVVLLRRRIHNRSRSPIQLADSKATELKANSSRFHRAVAGREQSEWTADSF